MDETYVGGKPRNRSMGDGEGGKRAWTRHQEAPVVGAVERGGTTAKAVAFRTR